MQFIIDYTKDLYNKYKERKDIHYYIYNFDNEDIKLWSQDTEHLFFSPRFEALQYIPVLKHCLYIGSNVKWENSYDSKLDINDLIQDYKYIFLNNQDLFCLKSGKALFLKNEIKSIIPYYWEMISIKKPHNDLFLTNFYITKKSLHLYEPWVDFIYCDKHTYLFDDNEKEEDALPKNIIEFEKKSLVDIAEMKLNCGGRCEYCNKCDLLYKKMGLAREKLGLE